MRVVAVAGAAMNKATSQAFFIAFTQTLPLRERLSACPRFNSTDWAKRSGKQKTRTGYALLGSGMMLGIWNFAAFSPRGTGFSLAIA